MPSCSITLATFVSLLFVILVPTEKQKCVCALFTPFWWYVHQGQREGGIKRITRTPTHTISPPAYLHRKKSTDWSTKVFAEFSHSLWFIWCRLLCKVYPLTVFFPSQPLLADVPWWGWMRTGFQSTAGARRLPQMGFFNSTCALNQLHGDVPWSF